MLTLSALGMEFGGEATIAALDLAIRAGEFVVALGPSGCGKTTLLRLAAGSLAPTSGRIENGFKRVAMVFQEPRLLPWFDALDNAAFALKALGRPAPERRRTAHGILRRLGLSDEDCAKRPATLSGGMRQRVAIARALAIEPDLLLMDEPFVALDVGLRRDLQNLVRAEADRTGSAVLFVTHDIAEAVRLASRIIVLSPHPAMLVADVANEPVANPALALAAAAALLRRPGIEQALFASGAEASGPTFPGAPPGEAVKPASPQTPKTLPPQVAFERFAP
ncbi:MAG: ABC transporter ATP-binding protein [Methylocella sp.]